MSHFMALLSGIAPSSTIHASLEFLTQRSTAIRLLVVFSCKFTFPWLKLPRTLFTQACTCIPLLLWHQYWGEALLLLRCALQEGSCSNTVLSTLAACAEARFVDETKLHGANDIAAGCVLGSWHFCLPLPIGHLCHPQMLFAHACVA